jgi:lipopolysaccharide exporter
MKAAAVQLRQWLGPGIARGIGTLAAGTVGGNLMLLLASPLVSRLYEPADLGRLAAFLAFANVAVVVASLCYEYSVVTPKDPADAAKLAIGAVAVSVPLGLLASLVLLVFIKQNLLGYGELVPAVAWLVAPYIWVSVAGVAARYWLVRERAFGPISRALVVQNGGRALGQVGLGSIGLGWGGLVLGDLVGRLAGTLRMAAAGRRTLPAGILPMRWREVRRTLARYREFPIYSLPSTLLDALALNLTLPMLVFFYGTAAAGQFSLVQFVLAIPVALLGSSLGDVFHGRIAADAHDAPERIRPFFLRMAATLFVLGSVPIGLFAVFGPRIFSTIYGSNWELAGAMTTALAPWAVAQLVVGPLSRVVYVLGGQRLKLAYDVVSLAAVVGVLGGAGRAGLPVLTAVGLLSIAQALAYVLYFVLLLRIVARHRP